MMSQSTSSWRQAGPLHTSSSCSHSQFSIIYEAGAAFKDGKKGKNGAVTTGTENWPQFKYSHQVFTSGYAQQSKTTKKTKERDKHIESLLPPCSVIIQTSSQLPVNSCNCRQSSVSAGPLYFFLQLQRGHRSKSFLAFGVLQWWGSPDFFQEILNCCCWSLFDIQITA